MVLDVYNIPLLVIVSFFPNSVRSKDCDLGVGVGVFDLCGDRVFCSRARIHQAGVGRLNLSM